MSDKLYFKIHNYIYSRHPQGVTFEEIQKEFPFNPDLVKATFDRLVKEKHVVDADFYPGEYFSQLACDDDSRNQGCRDCGSNVHSECMSIDRNGNEIHGLHHG